MAGLSYRQSATFYDQFSQMVKAGIPVTLAFDHVRKAMPHAVQAGLVRSHTALSNGQSLADSLKTSHLLPPFDLTMIQAAEKAGNLEDILNYMSQRYDEKDTRLSQIRRQLAYPAILLLVSVLSFRFPALFLGQISGGQFLSQTLGILVALGLLVYVGVKVVTGLIESPKGQSALSPLITSIPLLGRLFENLALEEYYLTLGMMVHAGIPIIESSESASQVSKSFILRQKARRITHLLNRGLSVTEAFSQTGLISPKDLSYVSTGEQSGTLEKTFLGLAKIYRIQNEKSIALLAGVVPKLIYFCILIWVAYSIIKGFTGHTDQLFKQIDGL